METIRSHLIEKVSSQTDIRQRERERIHELGKQKNVRMKHREEWDRTIKWKGQRGVTIIPEREKRKWGRSTIGRDHWCI